MNFPYFISHRIRNTKNLTFSSTVFKIGVASIAVGLAVLIISYAVLFGFKSAITQKIFSFGGDIQVSKIKLSDTYEEQPFEIKQIEINKITADKSIESVQLTSNRIGLLRADQAQQGIILKGTRLVKNNQSPFEAALVSGRFLSKQKNDDNELVISSFLAKQLKLKLNESVIGIFPPKARKFKIIGVYETGLEEIDKSFVVCDLSVLQKLNGWGKDSVGKIEIYLSKKEQINPAFENIQEKIGFELTAIRVANLYPQIYDWLQIIDKNVVVILMLILVVACFNLVSVLIIMMMERTELIGVMKAMGSSNGLIVKVFNFTGLRILLLGLLIGNVLGLGICFIQKAFRIIPLDAQNYFISYVPIEIDFLNVIELNILFAILISVSIYIPIFIITRMKPLQALKFKK